MNVKSILISILFAVFVTAKTHGAENDTADNAELNTKKKQLSYIFGINAGQSLKAENVDIDMESFIAGIADIYAGKKPQLDQATAQKVIENFQQKKAQQYAELMNKKAQLAKQYMTENAKKAGVVTTESGLQYNIIDPGDGETPISSDRVVVHYKGTLLDGTVFDSSYERGEPATFVVTNVIKGWQEALQKMKEGAKWQVVVPANLAYGARGAGPTSAIGPNETLIFDIELIAITK